MPNALGRLVLLAVVAAAAVGVAAVARPRDRGYSVAPSSPSAVDALAWQRLVGGPQPSVDVGQRMIVVLRTRSLAGRVALAGGLASDRAERRWTARALATQRLFFSRMRV